MASERVPERIGFIGLGNMGAPMARRLARSGFQLALLDAVPAAVDRLVAEIACDRPSTALDLGRACRVIITMLPDGDAVRQALLGDGGVVAGLCEGSVVIDMTSASPVGTRKLAGELATRGVALVDAPVSGGVQKAAEGTLAIMAGGEATTVAQCRPILDAMGQVYYTGPVGCGHAMKALNNYLSAAALVTAAEAIISGERFGIDPAVMIRILNASSGRNTATEHKYPAFVLPRTFNSGFALGLMAKDLRSALQLAQSSGVPSALLQVCADMYASAERQLGFRADNSEIVKYLESLVAEGSGG